MMEVFVIHFFEKLEREINFSKEYDKIEKIICTEYFLLPQGGSGSINTWIERNFSKWNKRKAYTSFDEVREQCGFARPGDLGNMGYLPYVTMENYFLFTEMLVNLVSDLEEVSYMEKKMSERYLFVLQTIKANLEQAGFEIKKTENGYIVVEKNAVAIEVASNNPEMADVIIEYNRYLLKGNLTRKREILLKIADALEPKHEILNQIDKSKTGDYFMMVNNMNVRHNNSDPASKNYNPAFAELPDDEKEEWYDIIYRQGLILFSLLIYQEDKKRIDDFKKHF